MSQFHGGSAGTQRERLGFYFHAGLVFLRDAPQDAVLHTVARGTGEVSQVVLRDLTKEIHSLPERLRGVPAKL